MKYLCHKLHHYMEENPGVGRVVKIVLTEVGFKSERLPKRVRLRHLLDVLANNFGIGRIKEKVKRPLKGYLTRRAFLFRKVCGRDSIPGID